MVRARIHEPVMASLHLRLPLFATLGILKVHLTLTTASVSVIR